MITETTFIGCDNLPPEMAAAFDVPWTFIGEIMDDRLWMAVQCLKCSQPQTFTDIMLHKGRFHDITTVCLRSHWFITGDRLEVLVFFGRCETCGSVFWARRGPPFRRVRSYKGVLV